MRFLGQRVYLGAVVVLASAIALAAKTAGAIRPYPPWICRRRFWIASMEMSARAWVSCSDTSLR